MARLEQVTLDTVAQPDIYALVRGYDLTGTTEQVQVSFAFEADSEPERTVTMDYDDLVTQTGLTLSINGVSSTLSWQWSGSVKGAWGTPDPNSGTSGTEWEDVEVAHAIDNDVVDARALFLITLIALDKWGVEFHCPAATMDLDRAIGNEDLMTTLRAFWIANALSAAVTQMGTSLDISVSTASTVETMTSEVVSHLLTEWSNLQSTGNPFNSDPGIGFSEPYLSALWATAHLDGVCQY